MTEESDSPTQRVPSPRKILKLGHPGLRERAAEVTDIGDPEFKYEAACLLETLMNFQKEIGFGRAIAAPQIGVGKRVIATTLNGWPSLMINPLLWWRGHQTFSMWDDCMSFPDLLIRVERISSVSLRFQDANGAWHIREKLRREESELFQHEIDHLDGILAVDRALRGNAMVLRDVFEEAPEYFAGLVDKHPE